MWKIEVSESSASFPGLQKAYLEKKIFLMDVSLEILKL